MPEMEPESAASLSLPSADLSSDDVQAMSYQKIMPLLHGLKPDQFTQAAEAFHKLGAALESVRSNIQQTGESFSNHQSWRGAAAQKAMDKFQTMHDQASVLSAQCQQAGDALDWFGKDATPPYQQIPDPQVMSKTEADEIMASPLDVVTLGNSAVAAWGASKLGIGPDGQNKADTAARGYMTSYNQQLTKLNQSLPNDPNTSNAQNWGQTEQSKGSTTGSTGPGSQSGAVPGSSQLGGGTSSPGYSSSTSANPFARSSGPSPGSAQAPATSPAKAPNAPSPSTASLQGYTPPSAGTGSPFGGASSNLTGGGSANPFARMPMMTGGAGAGSGGGAAGDDIPGEGSLGKSALGKEGGKGPGDSDASGTEGAADESAAGEGAGAEAAGAGAGEGAGMNGMPMGGSGGGGQQEQERQRQAWMSQDESIWGVPGDDVGPIIG